MRTHAKILACAAIAALSALLSCNNASDNAETAETVILHGSNGTYSDMLNLHFIPGDTYKIAKMPVMDGRIISYKMAKPHPSDPVLEYESGFTDDPGILKSWFPNTFNWEQAEADCNYFAFYFLTRPEPFAHYLILSRDMILHAITCSTEKELIYIGDGFYYETMLVCDDKAGTLRKSIDIDSMRIYRDPDWDCESGAGGPNWHEVYFEDEEKISTANIIENDVAEWIAEQLASKGDERKRISISDMQLAGNGIGKRKLPVPGVIYESHINWEVLITAGELAEFLKEYDNLMVSFYVEVIDF